jgi:ABC-type polar amino acid transport system ATPase subunit
MTALLTVRGLRAARGGREILRGVDLSIGAGERVVVLGANGSGKSTLLRAIAGLDPVEGGEVAGAGRSAGLVLQQGALFPHLSALDNVALAPRLVGRLARDESERRAREILARVGIPRVDAMPHELSGGQQQRVDAAGTEEVERVLRELSSSGIASVTVTHDLAFAARVATRTLRLEGGVLREAT